MQQIYSGYFIMMHYCNKQSGAVKVSETQMNPINNKFQRELKDRAIKERKSITNDVTLDNLNNNENQEADEELVIPPGCSNSYLIDYLKDNGISVKVYGENSDTTKIDPRCAEKDYDYVRYGKIGMRNTGYITDNKFGDKKLINNNFSKECDTMKCNNTKRDMSKYNSDASCYRKAISTGDEGYIYDNMSGKFNFLSVPPVKESENSENFEGDNINHRVPLALYLNNYIGKHICLDLWTVQRNRIEKCGTLTRVGSDFIAIKNPGASETLIDLKSIRYISVFCR